MKDLIAIPQPSNKTELESFLGIMVYLAKFIPNLSNITGPLRELLEKGVEWTWQDKQEKAFINTLKAIAATAPVLKYYDANKPVKLATDASNKGFGAVISQDGQPVAYASRRLNSAEENYAPIEKEMCAIQFGCTRFHDYIYGSNVVAETDHKPLVGIFNKPIHKLSPRIQRMRIALLRYDLEVVWIPGKDNIIPDTLSRATINDETPLNDDEYIVNSIISQLAVTDKKLIKLREESIKDPTLKLVRQFGRVKLARKDR